MPLTSWNKIWQAVPTCGYPMIISTMQSGEHLKSPKSKVIWGFVRPHYHPNDCENIQSLNPGMSLCKKSGVHQLGLVVYTVICNVFYIPAGAGFFPSIVSHPLAPQQHWHLLLLCWLYAWSPACFFLDGEIFRSFFRFKILPRKKSGISGSHLPSLKLTVRPWKSGFPKGK